MAKKVKKCPKGKVRNPASGRCVSKKGKLGRSIIEKGKESKEPSSKSIIMKAAAAGVAAGLILFGIFATIDRLLRDDPPGPIVPFDPPAAPPPPPPREPVEPPPFTPFHTFDPPSPRPSVEESMEILENSQLIEEDALSFIAEQLENM